MPQHPSPSRATPSGPTRPGLLPSGPVPERPLPARDLTVNKVLAGAGAAATSAVLGSFFGAAGTVAGAALGSVASTVATTIYQHSLDRTRDTVVARIRPVRGRFTAADETSLEITVPMSAVPPDGGPGEPPQAPRRPWGRWIGATVIIFALGLFVVTGLEWFKGSTLSVGESGTSVGRVLSPAPAEDGEATSTPEPTTTPEPTSDSDPTTTKPSSSADPSRSDDEPRNGGGSGDSQDSESGGEPNPSRITPTPTPTPAAPNGP